MDRKPTPPPFPVGVRVRYLGTRKVTAGDTGAIVLAPGIEVEIVDTHKGRRGTLAVIDAEPDDDDPAFDRTVDGYSVYNSPIGRRCIWPRDRGEWELVSVHEERSDIECQPEAVRIAELVAASPASLRDEVRYLMEDVEREGDYTEWDALRDLEDRDEPELRTPLRRLLIRLGVYREFTSVDASAIVMGGGRSRSAQPDFRLDGKGWTFDRWPDVA